MQELDLEERDPNYINEFKVIRDAPMNETHEEFLERHAEAKREKKKTKRSSIFMKGVCGCGRRSPPILVAVRVNPAKKIHIKFVKLCVITQHKLTAILLQIMHKKV